MAAQQPDSLHSRSIGRKHIVVIATVLLATVIVLEEASDLDYSLEVLYAIPVVVAAISLNRWQILILGFICASARSYFTPGPHPVEFWLRFAMALLAYGGVGVLVSDMSRTRRMILDAYARLSLEKNLRYRAENRLRILAESSPAGILTLGHRCEVLAANQTASQMLGFENVDSLVGKDMAEHLPVFSGALRANDRGRPIRVATACWAKRVNGSLFPASVWFSTYEEEGQRRLAAIMVDTSEEVREREHEALRDVIDANRLLAGAVAHEIRNMCSAIRVVNSNLGRNPNVAQDPDFLALNTLVESLMRIAAFELTNGDKRATARIDVTRVLEMLRVVIEPDWADSKGVIRWRTDEILPYVHADEHALLQVLLNLSANALRAAKRGSPAHLDVSCSVEDGHVVISLQDDGHGVADAAQLFQPFCENSDGTGLGLYVSRAIMRGFGGDLKYVPVEKGCRFDVVLRAMIEKDRLHDYADSNLRG